MSADHPVEPAGRSGLVRLLDHRRLPLLLAIAAAGIAIAVFHLVYPNLSWNRDEPVFLWQADLLLDGQLTQSDGGFPAQFRPWLSAHRDGRFFGQYPLGWPAPIAVGKLIGFPAFAPALGAVLFVLGGRSLALELTRNRRRANGAALLLLASPILAVQSGVYLNYLFTAGLGAFFTALLLRGTRTGSRAVVAGAGGLLGLVFLTRTYDAAVWAAAVGGFVVVTERERRRELLRLLPPFLLALAPALLVQALHNLATTGSVTAFALSVADPLDRFGFGPRRMMPLLEPHDHTITGALRDSAKHLFFLPWFLFGAHLMIVAAALGAWRSRLTRGGRLAITLCLAFPIAYLPFWGIHISSLTTRISGPIYFIPVYIPLCILAVEGIIAAHRSSHRLVRIGLALSLLATAVIGAGRLGINRQLSRIQGEWATATDDIENAVIVVSPSSYLLFLDPDSMARPDRVESRIHATDVDPGLIELIDRLDRPAVLITPSVPVGELAPSEHTEPFTVIRHDVVIDRGAALVLSIEPGAADVPVTTVDVATDDLDLAVATMTATERARPATVEVRLGGDRRSAGPDGIVVDGPTILDVVVGHGADPETARRTPTVRHRLLVDRSDDGEVRILRPGRFYRPESENLAEGEIVWLEDIDRGDLRIDVLSDPPAR